MDERTFLLPLPAPRTMAEMIREATRLAEVSMRKKGTLVPCLLAATPDGLLLHHPSALDTEEEKDRFVMESRLILLATAVERCAVVLETWVALSKRGRLPDCPPSESPDRIEAVSIVAEERGSECRMVLLPTVRDHVGRFVHFGDDVAPPGVVVQGRFAQQLPPKPPTQNDAETARLYLGTMGIKIPSSKGFSTN